MTNLIISVVMLLSSSINETEAKFNRTEKNDISITNFKQKNSNLMPQLQIKSHLS